MAERYFIDGYNLMHKHPQWSALARDHLELARDTLVEAVAKWAVAAHVEACVFFDGRGRRAERHTGDPGRPGVEVVFTSAQLTADALIERDVYDASHRHRAVVVTADNGIRDLCSGMGALTMRPEHFLSMLESTRTPTAPTASPASSPTLGDALDDDARDALLRLRKHLDERAQS